MTKQYDKFTIGSSPCAIFLIDLINRGENAQDRLVIKRIETIQKRLSELVRVRESNIVSHGFILSMCNLIKNDCINQAQELLNLGCSEIAVNLFKNVCTANIRNVSRGSVVAVMVVKSGLDRARSISKQTTTTVVNTYGKIDNEMVDVAVSFSETENLAINNYKVNTAQISAIAEKNNSDTQARKITRAKSRAHRRGLSKDFY